MTASKKKNFEATEVFTSMTIAPAITVSRPMIFMTRMPFKIMYPGPASDFEESAILVEVLLAVALPLRKMDVIFSIWCASIGM